jgi:hypothetical protein
MFEMLNKKIWANFQRIIVFFTQKIVTKLSKIWVWDPGSEIRDPEKTYSGSRIQSSKRHRIPDPDPQHCFLASSLKRGPFEFHTHICQKLMNTKCKDAVNTVKKGP